MDFLAKNAVAQGMVLASLIGGIALAAIAQFVSAFAGCDETPGETPSLPSSRAWRWRRR
jgi:hypothetical protein